MNILIVGDGKVGYTLAEDLSAEGHDVTVVDSNPEALERAEEALDVLCVHGSGADVKTLLEAGVERADILISVMASDEINMICSMMGKHLGAKYVITRIRSPEYTDSLSLLQNSMGIDMVINPERRAALEISQLFRYPFAVDIETFARGRVELAGFLPEESDGLFGIPLKELGGRFIKVLCCACERDDRAIIPDGNFVIEPGDKLYVAGDLMSITHFFKKLGRNIQRVRSAVLIGGSHISYYLAKTIAGMGVDLRIIEIKPEKCKYLAQVLEDVTVINADGTDQKLLISENLSEMDAMVCLTDRDEENLMAGLFGVREGAKKVIVKVNRQGYLDLIKGMGIDSVISPTRTTANNILRQVRARARGRDSVVEKIHRAVGGQVEALQFTVNEDASYLNTPLSRLRIQKGVLVAVIVRKKQVIIPFGSDHIEAGDTVILMTRTSGITSLEEALQR